MKNFFIPHVLTEAEIKKTFEDGYKGPDIYAMYHDGSDVLVHNNGLSLDWCLNAMHNDGCVFFYN